MSFEMIPGVVVDPASERLYLMNPQGGIDAVELSSGHLLWTSRAAGKPLAAFDDELAAQADATRGSSSLPIVLLNSKTGREVSRIEMPMPTGVMPPTIDDQIGSTASVNARVEPDGLLVWWTVTSREVSGIPGPASGRSDSGAALINLQTRNASTLAPDQAEARLRSKTSPAISRLSGTEGLYFPPQPAGRVFVSVKLGPASAGQPAVMKRWGAESGETLPDVDLGPGFVATAISGDQSLLLVVRRAPAMGAGYLWTLYAIASGERVAEVRLPDSGGQPFFVWNSILICKTDGLRGLNLKTGTEIWRQALRDTSYHGQYPPRP